MIFKGKFPVTSRGEFTKTCTQIDPNNVDIRCTHVHFTTKNTLKSTSKYLPKSIQNDLKMRPGQPPEANAKPDR